MRILILALLTLPAFGAQLFGAQQWIELKTRRFELYSGASESATRETLHRLDQMDAFLSKLPEFKPKSEAPVRVVIFSTVEQFAPYKAKNFEAGHYESSGVRDWIALGPVYDPLIVAHEFTHLTVHRAGLQLPAWLNEGLADFFSTAAVTGAEVRIGAVPQTRMNALTAGKWMDLEALLAFDDKRYEAMTEAEAGVLYPESWALTHMFYMSPDYAGDFPKLLRALDHNKAPGDVLQRVYQKGADAVTAGVRSYIAQPKLADKVLPLSAGGTEAPAPAPAAYPITPFVTDLILADLLGVMGNKTKDKEARAAFEQLNARYRPADEIRTLSADDAPSMAAIYVQLGLTGRESDPNAALLEVVDRITKLPQIQQPKPDSAPSLAEMYFQIGLAKNAARQPAGNIAEAFDKSVTLRPDYLAAHQQLIKTWRKAQEYGKAVEAVNRAVAALPDTLELHLIGGEIYTDMKDFPGAMAEYGKIPADSGFASSVVNGYMGVAASYREGGQLDSAMDVAMRSRPWVHGAFDTKRVADMMVFAGQQKALAALRAGNLAEAGKTLDSYRPYASGVADRNEADRIADLMKARAKGKYAAHPGEKAEHVEGTVQGLDCTAAGPLLRVMAGDRELKFDLPGPELVEVRAVGTKQIDIACGKMEPFHIAIDYVASGVAGKTSSGIIRQMAF
jgi:tetratricopeptide (TPR) repeat protein